MVFIFGLDVLTLGMLSLGFQTVAYALLMAGFYFARVEKDFARHRIAMAGATGLNLISLLSIMLVALPAVILSPSIPIPLKALIYFHHIIGAAAIVVATVLAVRSCDWVDKYLPKRRLMVPLLITWTAAYVLGIIIFTMLYLAP